MPKLTIRNLLPLLISVLAPTLLAGQGDKPGEKQAPPPSHWKIPPAPVVPPDQAISTFKVAPGFKLELIAADPLIDDPVCVTWDGDNRLWVAEMIGYMPDVDGKGEDVPNGRIKVLEDTDGDWKYDKATVFADGLILPRAITLVKGGVLIAVQTPKQDRNELYFLEDTNGDLKSDKMTLIAKDYGNAGNPEHTANSIMTGLDNWIYSANCTTRFRPSYSGPKTEELPGLTPGTTVAVEGDFRRQRTNGRGQWGISQDDIGRLYYNGNSDTLRCDLIPTHYLSRNPNFKGTTGVNHQVVKDQSVWPCRITAGVNRGYRSGQLRPDGTLVIVDLYRGILQHKVFVTSYLKDQILGRGLDKPLGLGRVYRMVHEQGKPIGKQPKMSKESAVELVAHLEHPNGWWRDTAQRYIIERGDESAVPALQKLVNESASPLAKIHALWTLEGLNKLDGATVLAGLNDKDARVRMHAIRVSEILLRGKDKRTLVPKLVELSKDEDVAVRLQVAASIVEAQHPKVDETLEALFLNNSKDNFFTEAILSGLGGRELDFLEALLKKPEWAEAKGEHPTLIKGLASCVFIEGEPTKVVRLLDIVANSKSTRLQNGILEGIANAKLPGMKNPRTVKLTAQPAAFKKLEEVKDKKVADNVKSVKSVVSWPDKAGVAAVKLAPPFTPEQQVLFDEGKKHYLMTCGTCHQPNGLGEEGKAPPLLDSDWSIGSEGRLIRIALHGVRGPIMVNGSSYNMEMPAVQGMDDRAIAAVLTYIRREWGHQGSAISVEDVKKVRAETSDRDEQWTEKELLKIK